MKSARLLLPLLVAGWFVVGMSSNADAQYPVAVVPVQTVSPVVVGYSAQRRGLFGRRVVYRPVVSAPYAVPVAPVVGTPVVAARPVVTARPVAVVPSVTVARPVVVAPAPVAVPVMTYRVPTVPIVPVQTYRLPVTPVWGW
ncbi:MAG: hypothetical protein P1U77_07425 [Rubripirellula sp.]|nr:hypothetical protein [Rubripirellula sp.]